MPGVLLAVTEPDTQELLSGSCNCNTTLHEEVLSVWFCVVSRVVCEGASALVVVGPGGFGYPDLGLRQVAVHKFCHEPAGACTTQLMSCCKALQALIAEMPASSCIGAERTDVPQGSKTELRGC